MENNHNRERPWWNVLLVIHLTCYGAFFVASLASFQQVWYMYQNNFIILLGWTIILLIHVAVHSYYTGRAGLRALERQAYRDGYADAIRQLAQRPDAVERLTIEDDGELLDLSEKRKRLY